MKVDKKRNKYFHKKVVKNENNTNLPAENIETEEYELNESNTTKWYDEVSL